MECYIKYKDGREDWIDPVEDNGEDVQVIDGQLVVDNGAHKYYYNMDEIESHVIRPLTESTVV